MRAVLCFRITDMEYNFQTKYVVWIFSSGKDFRYLSWYLIQTETTVVVSDTDTTDLYCKDSFSGMKPALFVWFHNAWLVHVYNIRVEGIPITLTLPWDGAPPRKGSPGGEKPRKQDSSLSGHWMGHLLSYSLSGGHDGAMPPINLRGLNGPLTSHFIFFPHVFFTKYTNTLLNSNAKLIKWVVERL